MCQSQAVQEQEEEEGVAAPTDTQEHTQAHRETGREKAETGRKREP